MSAFVCMPEHLGALAAAMAHYEIDFDIERMAEVLAKENIRSVAFRYPSDPDGGRPGPCLYDHEIVQFAVAYAVHYHRHGLPVNGRDLINMIRCYEYQTCETPDWEQTEAVEKVRMLRYRIQRMEPIFLMKPKVDWEFVDRETRIPVVESIYERRRLKAPGADHAANPAA